MKRFLGWEWGFKLIISKSSYNPCARGNKEKATVFLKLRRGPMDLGLRSQRMGNQPAILRRCTGAGSDSVWNMKTEINCSFLNQLSLPRWEPFVGLIYRYRKQKEWSKLLLPLPSFHSHYNIPYWQSLTEIQLITHKCGLPSPITSIAGI